MRKIRPRSFRHSGVVSELVFARMTTERGGISLGSRDGGSGRKVMRGRRGLDVFIGIGCRSLLTRLYRPSGRHTELPLITVVAVVRRLRSQTFRGPTREPAAAAFRSA